MSARTIGEALEHFEKAIKHIQDKCGIDSQEYAELCKSWEKFCKVVTSSYPLGKLATLQFDNIELNERSQKAYGEILRWVKENLPGFSVYHGEVLH